MKPSLFIGSSSESLDVAEMVQVVLERTAEITIWNQGVFGLNESGFESLLKALNIFDFACFVLSEDDVVISRDEKKTSVRDNVILEIGLFLGRLGRNRVFIFHGRNSKPSLPSDLAGINFIDYDDERKDKNLRAALTPSCTRIKDEIKRSGILNREAGKPDQINKEIQLRVDEVVSRGSTNYIDIIADSALYIADQKYKYKDDLKKCVLSKQVIPSKFLYYTDEGCQHWLDICNKPGYKFYSNSVNQLTTKVSKIISIASECTGISEFDFISLGSGNGDKDNIILKEMQKHVKDNEKIFFYPIDISDPMIIEAVRNSMANNLNRKKVLVKAIVGDITILEPLSRIYEERPNKNLFSILGNTIGNSDEKAMMDSIKEAMFDGDIILIEVNVNQDDIEMDDFYKDELNMTHDFIPLASLGVSFDKKKMKYENISNSSVVDGTITTMAYYSDARIGGSTVKNIKLSAIHHYKLNKFISEIEKRLKVKTIYSSEDNGVGLVLAQR